MKMLLVAIFALSCAQIYNAAGSTTVIWFPPPYTTPPYPEATITVSPSTAGPTTEWSTPDWPTHEWPTSKWPTSDWSTTNWPTTEWPTSNWPTHEWPTSKWPTSDWSTTNWPTTEWPTSNWPTHEWPTSKWPTSDWSTTNWPTTEWPTSNWPTHEWPTSKWPTSDWSTTNWPTTEWPTSNWPTHEWPTSKWPTSDWSTTNWPTTEWPTSNWPTTIWPTSEWTSTNWPTTTYWPTPDWPIRPPLVTNPSDDYYPDEELETCGFKYGATAARNQFPYVAFLRSRNSFKVQYCSGSLIHPRWVLTSAYCMLPDSTVDVILGALVPFDEDDPYRVVVQSEAVFVHPGYLPIHLNPKNDVALIKLSRPVTTAAIIPIVLKWDSGLISKDKVTFAGWGEAGYETLSYTRNIQLFKAPCRCLDAVRFTDYEDAAMDSEHFCGVSTEFFCFIHNGGGLVVDGVLVAVLSTRCFPHCRHHEGIFTNIYNHLQWIYDTLNEELGPEVYGACSDPSITKSGVYFIQLNNDVELFEVYCEIRLDGKKWTVIQQRFSKEVDFYRNYANYTNGFGPLTGNHWLGLEKIHQLTKNDDHELMVELQAHNLTSAYAQYSTFKVDSQGSGFKLTITGYSGNAGDSMVIHNGMRFSTFDNDQDMLCSGSCSRDNKGGWWYNNCAYSNLNGPYHDTAYHHYQAMTWIYNFEQKALKAVRMMIRKK